MGSEMCIRDRTSGQAGGNSEVHEDDGLYKEINRMLVICFLNIFATPEFQQQFDIHNFDRAAALIWIRHSNLKPATIIVKRLAEKSKERKNP